MILKILFGAYMLLVIAAAFLYAPPALGLGEISRIIYFHVPLAWVGVLAYLVSMVNSIRYLKRPLAEYDFRAAINAEIGLVFTLLATVTGAIFARGTWGVYWNWDPRQTSIFVLLLIYGAYLVLRSSLEDGEKRARLAAVYSIVAFISVPFLVFIIPRLYVTLHPDPIINQSGQLQMNARMMQVFLASLLGFTGIYWWIYSLQVRLYKVVERLEGQK
ncbi:MAG TPA: cytochrome c biogenesis protein CcsA [Bacillota bacterium]|nr:cytochrome c biogenesis protein CcsA [Bacillota bacterium]